MNLLFLCCSCWFLGTVLGYAASAKTGEIRQLGEHLSSLGIAPRMLGVPLACLLLASEYVLAFLLVCGQPSAVVFLSTATLFGVFTLFVAWIVFTRRKVSCFCFGDGDAAVSMVTVMRNLMLFALALGAGIVAMVTDLVWWYAAIPCGFGPIACGIAGALLFLSAYQLESLWSASRSLV